jgi:Fe-S cluster biogenesis protein NfuA
MKEFNYTPLIEGDTDILSDPESINDFNPVLGVRKSIFKFNDEENIITEGPLVDGVNKVLEELRDYIEADGGKIEFVDIKNGWVRLLFSGECGSCVVSASTLLLIEEMVCTAMPEIKGVESIQD